MLKCGFYEKEITPPLGCDIPGYYTKRVADGVVDKLYCKALAVSDGNETVIMMAVDALYLMPHVHEALLKRASEYTGLSTDNLSVSAIHTHTGIPRTLANDPVVGDDAYDDYFVRIGADCMTLAFQAMEECVVKFGKGKVEGIAFNRVYNMKDGSVRTAPEIGDENVSEPNGPTDPELTVLYVEDMEGNPKGAIVNYACHPDVIKGTKYSGDWPSVLSYRLKDEFGRDFVSLFLNGASGNINHVDVINGKDYPPSEHYITMGNVVAKEAIKAIKSSEGIKGDNVSVKKEILKLPERPWDIEKIEHAKHIVATIKPIEGATVALGTDDKEQEELMNAKIILRAYGETKDFHEVGVQAIRIGDTYIYTLPFEMFVQFGLYIKENSPSDKNIIAELSHGLRGYVPLKDLICDTVYESRRGAFKFEPGTGEMIAQKAVDLAKELK